MNTNTLLLCLGVVWVSAACSTKKTVINSSTSATKKIGAQGGKLQLGTGVTLEVPAGALSGEVELSVSELEGSPVGYTLMSKRYALRPAGTTFAQPVQVTIARLPAATGGVVQWSKLGQDDAYDALPTTDVAGGAQAANNHFSQVFVGEPTTPTTECSAGLDQCGNECFNLQTSLQHCGTCATSCGTTQLCSAGVCITPITTITLNLTTNDGNGGPHATVDVVAAGEGAATTLTKLSALATSTADTARYSFEVTSSTYHLMVGCTLPDGTKAVREFRKTTATTQLDTFCADREYPPSPITSIDHTVQLTGVVATSEFKTVSFANTTGAGATCSFSTGTPDACLSGDTVSLTVSADDRSYDLVAWRDLQGGATVARVLRNIAPATEPVAAGTEAELVEVPRGYLRFETGLVPGMWHSHTTFESSRGSTSDILGQGQQTLEGTVLKSFVPYLPNLQGGELNHVRTTIFPNDDKRWDIFATVTSLPATSDAAPIIALPALSATLGDRQVTAVAVDHTDNGKCSLMYAQNTPVEASFWWRFDIDAPANGAVDYAFSMHAEEGVPELAAFLPGTGGDAAPAGAVTVDRTRKVAASGTTPGYDLTASETIYVAR